MYLHFPYVFMQRTKNVTLAMTEETENNVSNKISAGNIRTADFKMPATKPEIYYRNAND